MGRPRRARVLSTSVGAVTARATATRFSADYVLDVLGRNAGQGQCVLNYAGSGTIPFHVADTENGC